LVVAGLTVAWVTVRGVAACVAPLGIDYGFGAWGRVRVRAVRAEPTESDAGVSSNAVDEVEVCGGAELVHQGIGKRA
jgi:hypothetical protein